MLSFEYIDKIIKTALDEDINYIDITSDYMIDGQQISSGRFVSKASGIVCGIYIAMRVFELLDSDFKCDIHVKDGQAVKNGDVIVEFSGKTVCLLKGERTALNLIQHLSGIATATEACVRLTEGTKAMITDTRKTLPGLRALQKYAVTVGGGKNHRFNLSDGAMLKDNHIDVGGGIALSVEKLRRRLGHMVKIEVETRSLDEVSQALSAGADIIMLDNMSNSEMAEAVKLVNGKALLEASGNMTSQRIAEVAKTGVDIISLGAITHSVTAFDISMKMDKNLV